MTRIPGLDAYLTREGPEHTCDPHEPFRAFELHVRGRGREGGGIFGQPGTRVVVYDDRDEEMPAVVTFTGPDAWRHADDYVEVRNREAPPPNEDGPAGSCTVCGDFHG